MCYFNKLCSKTICRPEAVYTHISLASLTLKLHIHPTIDRITGMNLCITDLSSLTSAGTDDDAAANTQSAYTLLWQQTVGKDFTLVFLGITLFAIECSNCANLTSLARMIYSFSRDGALPFSKVWYKVR